MGAFLSCGRQDRVSRNRRVAGVRETPYLMAESWSAERRAGYLGGGAKSQEIWESRLRPSAVLILRLSSPPFDLLSLAFKHTQNRSNAMPSNAPPPTIAEGQPLTALPSPVTLLTGSWEWRSRPGSWQLNSWLELAVRIGEQSGRRGKTAIT